MAFLSILQECIPVVPHVLVIEILACNIVFRTAPRFAELIQQDGLGEFPGPLLPFFLFCYFFDLCLRNSRHIAWWALHGFLTTIVIFLYQDRNILISVTRFLFHFL